MATIAEIREKYPQYSDMPDAALADALHNKFYADMPKADFYTKIGLTPSEGMPKTRTAAQDTAAEMKTATTAREAFDISQKNFRGNIDAAGRAALSKTIGTGGNIVEFVGKGVEALGGKQVGKQIQNAGKNVPARANEVLVGEDRARYPAATSMGGLASDVAITMPIGGIVGAGLKAIAPYVPSVARFITPVAESISTGGFRTGLGPTGPIKPITGLPSYTAKDVVAEGAARAIGGGTLGGLTTALTNPEDTGTGVLVGAGLPAVAAPFVKAGVTSAGRVIDLLSGRAGDIKAARIAKTALGDQLIPATVALQQARPGITAVQALQEAGIDAAPFMSLGVLAEQSSVGEAYRRLAAAQTQEQKNMLIALTGGGTQTGAREAQAGSKQALNALTTPMRETELQAANQAGQTISQLGPLATQREASMISALQGQGRAATDAAQAGVRAEAGAPGFLTQGTRAAESNVLSTEMAAIKAQRQTERDFLQRQIGSLEAYGLKPLNVDPILSSIDAKLANPNLYGQTQLLNVLQGLRDDFAGAVAANGGVADARALYSIRKAGISQKIDDMYGSLDPSAKQKLTADVLASVKAPIDKAITEAGGTGWNRYLQTFETGMHEIGQQKLAALALERFNGNKDGFLKLVRGNDPKAVEDIFGPGSFNIFKEMGRKSGQLETIASQLERDIAVKEAADSATQGLARIMGMAESKVTGVPAFFSKTATAVNMAAKILRGQVNEKTFAAFEKGMISGKSAAEMLAELPTSERNKVFRILKNSSEWNPSVATVGVQSSVDRTNNLTAKRNRNNLRP